VGLDQNRCSFANVMLLLINAFHWWACSPRCWAMPNWLLVPGLHSGGQHDDVYTVHATTFDDVDGWLWCHCRLLRKYLKACHGAMIMALFWVI
jgi:hypothetical protein